MARNDERVTSAGLDMENRITEVVLQTDRKKMNVDFLVESVAEFIEKITASGGKLVISPFDIPIGKCAVVREKWASEYVILDMSKGRYVTDEQGNVIGISKCS